MALIKDNFDHILAQVRAAADGCGRNPDDVTLIAVSKRKSAENILECIEAGGVHFGENYIQEAVQKIDIPVLVVNSSRAAVPAREFPEGSRPGDQTQTLKCPGMIARIPPPTPLFPGSPTR